MVSPSDLKLFSDKSKSLEAYELLCKKIKDVRVKPVSARLTEVVLLRTFYPQIGQKFIDEAEMPIDIGDSRFALHLTKKGITKGKTLKHALEFLKIEPEDVSVIGDSETDLSMFELCGYSAAVGNASEGVKSKADYVCKNEIGDGVVEAIQYITDRYAGK